MSDSNEYECALSSSKSMPILNFVERMGSRVKLGFKVRKWIRWEQYMSFVTDRFRRCLNRIDNLEQMCLSTYMTNLTNESHLQPQKICWRVDERNLLEAETSCDENLCSEVLSTKGQMDCCRVRSRSITYQFLSLFEVCIKTLPSTRLDCSNLFSLRIRTTLEFIA